MKPNTKTEWTITLNKYQRDNLLWLIHVCGYPHGNKYQVPRFGGANTGDWLGEVHHMLATGEEIYPNTEEPNYPGDPS